MSVALANINNGDKFEELIGSFDVEYAILQSIPSIHIGPFEELKKELGGAINPLNFEVGRLFSLDFEIRWRKKGGDEFYTLVISDKEQVLSGYDKKELKIMDSEQSFYLWGIKNADVWYESRIPRGWKYPVTGRYAKIKAIEYEVRERPDEGKFYRFCGFLGVNK